MFFPNYKKINGLTIEILESRIKKILKQIKTVYNQKQTVVYYFNCHVQNTASESLFGPIK